MKKCEKLIIYFNNRDVLEIPDRHIITIAITQDAIRKINYNNRYHEYNKSSDTLIQLDDKAVYYPVMTSDNKSIQYEGTTFDRIINGRDVSSIEVYYDDGSVDLTYVYWNQENCDINLAQTAYINDEGCLIIEIKKSTN